MAEEVKNTAAENTTDSAAEKKAVRKVSKDMTIGEIINVDVNLAGVLMGGGMYCIGCPASMGESLEEAAMVHGIDPDLLLERLNSYLEAQAQ